MPRRPSAPIDPAELARTAARAADDKKATDTVVLLVGEIIAITDAFVITTGSNTRQVRTIVDEIEKQLREDHGVRPRAVEGLEDATWVLVDYGDIVVHVFLDETREYYGLERLWADAPRLEWAVEAPPETDAERRGKRSSTVTAVP